MTRVRGQPATPSRNSCFRPVAAVIVDDHDLAGDPLHRRARGLRGAQGHLGGAVIQDDRQDTRAHSAASCTAGQVGQQRLQLGGQHADIGFQHHAVMVAGHLIHLQRRGRNGSSHCRHEHVFARAADPVAARDLPVPVQRRAEQHQPPVPGLHGILGHGARNAASIAALWKASSLSVAGPSASLRFQARRLPPFRPGRPAPCASVRQLDQRACRVRSGRGAPAAACRA